MILLDDEDQQLIRLLLLKLVAMIERGKFAELLEAGFLDQEFLNRIRDLKARDICRVSLHKGLRIGVYVDVPSLVHAVGALARGQDDDGTLDYYIFHGATIAMLQDLFRLSRDDAISRRRYLLGAKAAEELEHGGRAKLPRGAVRAEIERAWLGLQCSSIPLTTCYRKLHEQFAGLSLATIYGAVAAISRKGKT